MDTNGIREAVRKQPFEPFTIRLVDGRSINVPHPDYVAVSRQLAIVIHPENEAVTWLEPNLISSIEYAGKAPNTATGASGGHS